MLPEEGWEGAPGLIGTTPNEPQQGPLFNEGGNSLCVFDCCKPRSKSAKQRMPIAKLAMSMINATIATETFEYGTAFQK